MLYVSVEEANLYFDSDLKFNADWTALSEEDRSRYIIAGMRLLDSMAEWCGQRFDVNQEYEFPRDFSRCWRRQDLNDTYYRNNGIIPREVKMACFMLIRYVYYDNVKYRYIQELKDRDVVSFSDGQTTISSEQGIKDNIDTKVLQLVGQFTNVLWSVNG